MNRLGIRAQDIRNNLEQWSNVRLVVIGDTIVDQYVACEAVGMSAEAPVVVIKEKEERRFVGAAAIVASHIRALGAHVDLVSVVGCDLEGDNVRETLKERGIGDYICTDQSRPTSLKKRYMVENQKLLRVSRLEEHDVDKEVEDQIIGKLESLANKIDGIIVSDFVYGVITPKIIEKIRELKEKYGFFLFGDLQCSSQVGSILKYKGYSLLSPNERELRIALQDKDSGLESLSQRLIAESACEKLLVKLGSEGFIAYERGKNGSAYSQHFPALSVVPVDVAGAGDSVLAVMATGLASGQGMMETAAVACCMASLVVERIGNVPVRLEELLAKFEETIRGHHL
jgi:rfaE bifunctional protein kinase chain/domain